MEPNERKKPLVKFDSQGMHTDSPVIYYPLNGKLQYIVAEFKEAIKTLVKYGVGQNDNKVSFDIVAGHIDCKNPLYNEPTCYLEDLSAVEKVFKKEGIDMDWTYDRTHLNGTLTFRW